MRIFNDLAGGHQRHSVAISTPTRPTDSDSVDTSSLEDLLPLARYDYRHQFVERRNKNNTPPNLTLLPTSAILPANTTLTIPLFETAVFSTSRTSPLYIYHALKLVLQPKKLSLSICNTQRALRCPPYSKYKG
jgi:hypothetical protein